MNKDVLPIESVLPAVVETLRDYRVLILKAPPGAGKTTRVPVAILDAELLEGGELLMLEPRRIAARASARMIARLLNEPVGETVGYKVRYDKRRSSKTKIEIVTEGVLNRRLLSDPFLSGVSCVVFDEFHERSISADLGLAFMRELLAVREDLRVVVMSATLSVTPLRSYLGNCPVIQCDGREHSLEIEYVSQPDGRPLHIRATAAILHLLKSDGDDGGDVLVFLPGAPEIRRLEEYLAGKTLPGSPQIVPLFGALSAAEQDRALQPGTRRRIVLSTNIAETSLTIPSVTTVIDSGLVKLLRADPRSGLDRLETVRISRQSATQRAGRAGRIAPGRAFRLWTRAEHATLLETDHPEIRRVDLAPAVLQVLAFHPGSIEAFEFLERPSASAIRGALEYLRMLGALNSEGTALSERGKHLAALPLHPRIGAIAWRAKELGKARTGALLAALLGERDICLPETDVRGASETRSSDLAWRMDLLDEFEQDGKNRGAARRLGLRYSAAHTALKARDHLLSHLLKAGTNSTMGTTDTNQDRSLVSRLLLAGYPDRVCRRREEGSRDAVMVGGRGMKIDERSGVREGDLLIAVAAAAGRRGERSTSLVHIAHQIELNDLRAECPQLLRREQGAVFDPREETVHGRSRFFFADLLLAEKSSRGVDEEALAARLAAEAIKNFEKVFKPDRETRQLRDRLLFARSSLPEEAWPDVSDGAIGRDLYTLSMGKRSFGELEKIDWSLELSAKLDYRLRDLFEREVPERLEVPSGSQIRIDYSAACSGDGAPVLAVRIQELFGLRETPRIARGRVPLLIHLLAPSGRPAQVTTDLVSFWNNTYPEVRRELKGRYPKHHWPEDPWTTAPTRRTKKRR